MRVHTACENVYRAGSHSPAASGKTQEKHKPALLSLVSPRFPPFSPIFTRFPPYVPIFPSFPFSPFFHHPKSSFGEWVNSGLVNALPGHLCMHFIPSQHGNVGRGSGSGPCLGQGCVERRPSESRCALHGNSCTHLFCIERRALRQPVQESSHQYPKGKKPPAKCWRSPFTLHLATPQWPGVWHQV